MKSVIVLAALFVSAAHAHNIEFLTPTKPCTLENQGERAYINAGEDQVVYQCNALQWQYLTTVTPADQQD